MRKTTALVVTLLLFVGHSTNAFAWGETGHKTIGQIAQLHLANTHTLDRINQILRPGDTLANVATWADHVKTESRFGPDAINSDPDTQAFYRDMRNQHNRGWHFVDLPLGCAGYDPCPNQFKKQTDIVHMINLCVRKLRGGNVPQLTQRNALRMLVHLVGDLHQPLHVGVGFVNVNGPDDSIVIETNPAAILQHDFPHDTGGNDLLISGEASNNLHSFWDTDLVEESRGNRSIAQFAQWLQQNNAASPAWDGQGAFNTWAAQWASDTLCASRDSAYPTIQIGQEVVVDDRTKYTATKGDGYKAGNVPVVERQLAKGGYRLSKLLRAIFP